MAMDHGPKQMIMQTSQYEKIAILGGGNMGLSLARGLVKAGKYEPGQVVITRRNLRALAPLAEEGYQVTDDNAQAVAQADIVVVAVLPPARPRRADR